MSDELVREALREGTRVIVRAEVTPAGTPRIGTSSRIGTPRMGTPVVGTPIIGTPVLGTPFSGTPTSRRKNLAQCQLRALPQEEEEEAEVRIERKVELSTYVELEPEQRHLSLFHLVKSLLGCTRVAQGKHIRESGKHHSNCVSRRSLTYQPLSGSQVTVATMRPVTKVIKAFLLLMQCVSPSSGLQT